MPYGPYGETFEECVAKAASFADDPEAFCAWMKHEIQGGAKADSDDEWVKRYKMHKSAMATALELAVHAQAVDVTILKDRGSTGGVLEIPILSLGVLEFSHVTLDVTPGVLAELASNFAAYKAPVPVSATPHVPFEQRAGAQDAFIEALRVEGNRLWATIDVADAALWSTIKQRKFRGFSVELRKDLEVPAHKFRGWVLIGGIFTNRPAAEDIEFRLAAQARESGVMFSVYSPLSEEESQMADEKVVSLAAHEAKVGEMKAALDLANGRASGFETQLTAVRSEVQATAKKVAELEVALAASNTEKLTAQARANTLEAQAKQTVNDKKQLETKVVELESKIAEAKKKETASAAKEIIGAALEAGVAPVVFDGWEADPAAYVDANFVSLESFRSHVDKLCAVGPKVPGKPTSSGKASDHSDADKTAELSVEEKAVFQKVGLGTEFVNIDNEAEARDAFNKAQAKKAAQK